MAVYIQQTYYAGLSYSENSFYISNEIIWVCLIFYILKDSSNNIFKNMIGYLPFRSAFYRGPPTSVTSELPIRIPLPLLRVLLGNEYLDVVNRTPPLLGD